MSNDWEDIHRKIASGKKISKHEADQLVEKIYDNKILFSKYMCGFDLSDKQQLMMKSMSEKPHTMGNFSRQTGKSTTLALWTAHELYFGSPPSGGEHWIISYGPTQRKASRIFDIFNSQIIRGNPFLEDYIEEKNKKGYILLENGNKYESRTASPNTEVEGDSPTVIQIDESQGITDVQYYEGILPSGSTTSAPIHEIFTPGGRNHAYNTWMSNDMSITKITQPWYECPFINKDYVMRMKANNPPKKFAQEYLCEWNLDTGYAWNYHHIRAAALLPPDNLSPESNKTYYSGIDIGKSPDKTVHWICELTNRGLKTVFLSPQKDTDYPPIVNNLARELIRFRPKRTCIDATAVGEPVYDYLKKTIVELQPEMRGWIRRNLENIKITNAIKNDMVGEIDMLLSRNIHTYEEFLRARDTNDLNKIATLIENSGFVMFADEDAINEMTTFVKDVTKAGNTVYYGESGNHDDYPLAAMFCAHAYYLDQKKAKSDQPRWMSSGRSRMGGIGGSFSREMKIPRMDYTKGL